MISFLRGKIILDVDSGKNLSFPQKAAKFGARVISLDGKYSNIPPETKENSVAAFAQYLPFKESSFDETIGLFVFDWITTGKKQALQEMIRVTKPNGKIRIHPVFEELGHPEALKALRKKSIIQSLTRMEIDGYKTLIIWEYELKDIKNVENKVRKFIEEKIC